MSEFCDGQDREENMGEHILEALLSANIDTINDLNIGSNEIWFIDPVTLEERSGNVDLLIELITKQAGFQHLNIGGNHFSCNATLKIFRGIAEHNNTLNKL